VCVHPADYWTSKPRNSGAFHYFIGAIPVLLVSQVFTHMLVIVYEYACIGIFYAKGDDDYFDIIKRTMLLIILIGFELRLTHLKRLITEAIGNSPGKAR